jgi:hypothetical protein
MQQTNKIEEIEAEKQTGYWHYTWCLLGCPSSTYEWALQCRWLEDQNRATYLDFVPSTIVHSTYIEEKKYAAL